MESCVNDQVNKLSISTFLVVILSFFLNQQKPMFGYNLSFSDFAAVILIMILLLKGKMIIPQKSLLFFIVLSVVSLSTAFFISPSKFNYAINLSNIMDNYIKLISSFLYFLLGYIFFKNSKIELVYKWYSIGAVIIGFFGIIIVFFNISAFRNEFFFEGSRYIGLMNDPNYFSVVQCTALPYFIRDKSIKKVYRIISCIVIFLAVAISGSKTGMIIFISYIVFTYARIILSGKSKKQLFKSFVFFLLSIILLPLILRLFNIVIDAIVSIHPVFDRVRVLFYDFSSAIFEGGSSRDNTWIGAIDLIKKSPILGVGIGSYLTVRDILHGGGGLSHNTYLQIIAEWGIPLALTFLIFIFYVVIKHIIVSNKIRDKLKSIITRDILIILLLGSMSLSLNNARMFWFFLGALYQSLRLKNQYYLLQCTRRSEL